MSAPPLLFFLSDYGLVDEFVGAVHAVLARRAPQARVVDLTHLVPPHDVTAGALTLWRSVPWITPGVVLAVVDPGGGDRRAVAVQAGPPDRPTVLVGPDNGLLLPAALRLGGPTDAVELAPAEPPPPGATFAGLDVFAPAAAAAAAGAPLADLGRRIDPAGLQGRGVPRPVAEPDGRVRAEVLWVDHFGNAQLNVEAAGSGPFARAEAGTWEAPVRTVASYSGLGPGTVGLVVDSHGLLSLCLDRASAAARLGLAAGMPVWLTPAAPWS